MIALSFGLEMQGAIWLSNTINISVVERFRLLFQTFLINFVTSFWQGPTPSLFSAEIDYYYTS